MSGTSNKKQQLEGANEKCKIRIFLNFDETLVNAKKILLAETTN